MKLLDPNAAAPADSGIFGLSDTYQESKLIFLPVPWEATTSYGGGTSKGPEAILEASHQIDLEDLEIQRPYEPGFHFLPINKKIAIWNKKGKSEAQKIIKVGGRIGKNKALIQSLKTVNDLSKKVNEEVYSQAQKVMGDGKILGLVGGDHSTPFGAIQSAVEFYPNLGILHLDAHSDTRKAYEGFEWSHASIMRNVMDKISAVKKLVQVGIRDFCQEEREYIEAHSDRIKTFYDLDWAKEKAKGKTWAKKVEEIIAPLPQNVWVSFDIDGLDPRFCPHTGTPVPGGLEYYEAIVLLRAVLDSGRKIVGFDLNEVAPGKLDEWDANVGARMLYKMSAYTLASQGLCKVLG